MSCFWDWKEKEQGPEDGKQNKKKGHERYSNKPSTVKFEVLTEIK